MGVNEFRIMRGH